MERKMSFNYDHDVTPATWTRGPIANLFSSYVAASAISAAEELGLLEALARGGDIRLGEGADPRLDEGVLRALASTLQWAGVVTIEDDTAQAGPLFQEAYSTRGYFYWLVRGCGQLFATAPSVAWKSNRTGAFYHRDMRAVAIGSLQIGETEVEHLFDKLMLDRSARRVVDLGCGSGHRLIRFADNAPDITCLGLDISQQSVDLATQSVRSRGLSDRIAVRRADVRYLTPGPDFADVDTITCVFMGHDFWPMDQCVRTLSNLRTAFPAAEWLFLCDVVRTPQLPSNETPIFKLGFELIHALMGVYLPTSDEWQQAFARSPWSCVTIYQVDAPPGGHLFELVPSP
jgi:SAM-dependent methyltransferase